MWTKWLRGDKENCVWRPLVSCHMGRYTRELLNQWAIYPLECVTRALNHVCTYFYIKVCTKVKNGGEEALHRTYCTHTPPRHVRLEGAMGPHIPGTPPSKHTRQRRGPVLGWRNNTCRRGGGWTGDISITIDENYWPVTETAACSWGPVWKIEEEKSIRGSQGILWVRRRHYLIHHLSW